MNIIREILLFTKFYKPSFVVLCLMVTVTVQKKKKKNTTRALCITGTLKTFLFSKKKTAFNAFANEYIL